MAKTGIAFGDIGDSSFSFRLSIHLTWPDICFCPSGYLFKYPIHPIGGGLGILSDNKKLVLLSPPTNYLRYNLLEYFDTPSS